MYQSSGSDPAMRALANCGGYAGQCLAAEERIELARHEAQMRALLSESSGEPTVGPPKRRLWSSLAGMAEAVFARQPRMTPEAEH
jgi:hypothetical protein